MFLPALVLAAAAVLYTGCTRETKLKTKVYEKNVEAKLGDEGDDAISVKVKLEYPVEGAAPEVITKMTEAIIGHSVGNMDGVQSNVEKVVNDYVDITVDAYKETCQELIRIREEEEDGVFQGMLNWEDYVEGYFSGKHKNAISYIVYAYSYNGGAHGDEGEYAMVFDTATGNLITESDYFVPGYESELSQMLSAHLRESFEDPSDYESLFVKDIESNGNFMVSNKGVTYIYSPYEIGPHSLGTIRVTIPWEEVGGIVKESPTTKVN